MSAPRRTPSPHSVEAEIAVIGGLLFCGPALARVADAVEAADFFDDAHRAIFAAMLEVDGRGRPVDVVTVAEEMKRLGCFGTLAARGYEAYLAELSTRVGTVENIAAHAQIVREKATQRGLLLACSKVVDQCYHSDRTADELLDFAQQAVFEVQYRSSRTNYRHIGAVVHESLRDLQGRYDKKKDVTGVATGYQRLDAMTAGLQPGDLVIIAGRPSMGKTAFAMNIVESSARSKEKVPALVFSLEMKDRALVDRILCGAARIESQRYRTGALTKTDWGDLLSEAGAVAELPVWIDHSGAPTLAEIRAKTRRWRSDPHIFPRGQSKLGLVVIDYLQLVQGDAKGRGKEQNRALEISNLTRGLKALAKDLDVPIVALSQLNRSLESRTDKRPMMSDLRESGAIEQDADLIGFLYRDEVYNKNSPVKGTAEFIIAKQRNGPTGTVDLAFLSEYTRFESLASREDATSL